MFVFTISELIHTLYNRLVDLRPQAMFGIEEILVKRESGLERVHCTCT